jgi:hypothetical protein
VTRVWLIADGFGWDGKRQNGEKDSQQPGRKITGLNSDEDECSGNASSSGIGRLFWKRRVWGKHTESKTAWKLMKQRPPLTGSVVDSDGFRG